MIYSPGVGGGEDRVEAKEISVAFCGGHPPGQVAGLVSMVIDTHPCHATSFSSRPENLI